MYTDENYSVETQTCDDTSVIVYEAWRSNDQYHRSGGPAIIERDKETGLVVAETWLQAGQLHRIGGPAEVRYSRETGEVVYEAWWHHDLLHREDGPAVVERQSNGSIKIQEDWKYGYKRGLSADESAKIISTLLGSEPPKLGPNPWNGSMATGQIGVASRPASNP